MTFPVYPKINSVFKRDEATNYKTFLHGEWADPAFDVLSDIEWVGTEKVDGTNCRIHIAGDTPVDQLRFGPSGYEVGGKTENAQLHVELLNALHDVGQRAIDLTDPPLHGLTLYGEGYGPGIQKGGGRYRDDKGFILFDVMVTSTGVFLERENVIDIGLRLGIPVTPIVFVGSLNQAIYHFSEHRPIAAYSTLMRNDQAEGWVLRPARELRNRMGHRVITKIKTKDYPQ